MSSIRVSDPFGIFTACYKYWILNFKHFYEHDQENSKIFSVGRKFVTASGDFRTLLDS
jgi:hypothetical protein